MQNSPNIPLFRSITMFNGTDNIMWNIPSFKLNVRNILHNTISPIELCLGFE